MQHAAWFTPPTQQEGLRPDRATRVAAYQKCEDNSVACRADPECSDCAWGEGVRLTTEKCERSLGLLPPEPIGWCTTGEPRMYKSCSDYSAVRCCVHGRFGSRSRHCLANDVYVEYGRCSIMLASGWRCSTFSCTRGAIVSQELRRIVRGISVTVCSVVLFSLWSGVKIALRSLECTARCRIVWSGVKIVVGAVGVSVASVGISSLFYLWSGVKHVFPGLECPETCRILWGGMKSVAGAAGIAVFSAGIIVSAAALLRVVRNTLQFGPNRAWSRPLF